MNQVDVLQRERSADGWSGVELLPEPIQRAIRTAYATPVKSDRRGQPHSMSAASVRESEARELARLVVQFRPQHSLEVGLALGSSAIAISAARQACGLPPNHIALDPFQETLSGGVGLLEIERAGLEGHVHWLPEFSESYLLHCREAGRCFELIFIDGHHGIGQAVTDAFLAHDALQPGGVVAIHDSLLFSTMASIRHLIAERQYRVLPLSADSPWKRFARSVRYLPRLGYWYARHVIPRMHASLVALQRPPSAT
jgi:predicted O-methyltransferase YrrM